MDLKTFKFGFVFRKHEKINYLFITSSLVAAPQKLACPPTLRREQGVQYCSTQTILVILPGQQYRENAVFTLFRLNTSKKSLNNTPKFF
jgi:hypothetical protein